MREDIIKILIDRFQQEFPDIDFSDKSILTRLIIYPLAFAIESIFDLVNNPVNITNTPEFAQQLAKVFQIPLTSEQEQEGLIAIEVSGEEDLYIPANTLIIQLDNPNNTAITTHELKLSVDEINERIANNIPITVSFVGNLDLGAPVAFDSNPDTIIAATVVRPHISVRTQNTNDVINTVMLQRPFIYGTATVSGILSQLAQFNPIIFEAYATNLANIYFDVSQSKEIDKFVVGFVVDEDNNIIQLTDEVLDKNALNSFNGIEIEY